MPSASGSGADWEPERPCLGRHFTRDMEELWTNVLKMAAVVEVALNASVRALCEGRPDLAAGIKAEERAIDLWEVQIERQCLKVLALHQPVASDLRRVAGVLRVNNDLERMADLADHIAKRARKLARRLDPTPIPPELEDMGSLVLSRVRDALDSLAKGDVTLARAVIAGDRGINRDHRVVRGQFKQAIRRDPDRVNIWLRLLNTARNLERIGDHSASIAEAVIYMKEGDIVRHAGALAGRG